MARTNRDVTTLNREAHRLLDDAGRLGDQRVIAAGREFAVGDHVRALKNHGGLDVDNGDRGVITAIDSDRRAHRDSAQWARHRDAGLVFG